jgi:hypothetical protein
MLHLSSILPALGCVAMMLGGGFMLRLARRTPLARLPWLARRASRDAHHHLRNT